METKTKLEEQFRDGTTKKPTIDADKFARQFEDAADKAMSKSKIVEIRFVGVEFDYTKVKIGEESVNRTIAEGFQPFKDIVTDSGLVMIMVKRDETSCPI